MQQTERHEAELDVGPVDGEIRIAGAFDHLGGDEESGVLVVVPNASAHIMKARLALGPDVEVVVADGEIAIDEDRTVPPRGLAAPALGDRP